MDSEKIMCPTVNQMKQVGLFFNSESGGNIFIQNVGCTCIFCNRNIFYLALPSNNMGDKHEVQEMYANNRGTDKDGIFSPGHLKSYLGRTTVCS